VAAIAEAVEQKKAGRRSTETNLTIHPLIWEWPSRSAAREQGRGSRGVQCSFGHRGTLLRVGRWVLGLREWISCKMGQSSLLCFRSIPSETDHREFIHLTHRHKDTNERARWFPDTEYLAQTIMAQWSRLITHVHALSLGLCGIPILERLFSALFERLQSDGRYLVARSSQKWHPHGPIVARCSTAGRNRWAESTLEHGGGVPPSLSMGE
jgi:hypothetical protein